MNKQKCIANIKFSQQEVELMINSLENLIKFEVPFQDTSDWRKPYENLLKELRGIKSQMINKVEEAMINREYESTSVITGDVCEVCE
jgi:hypothetical protein|tara:strand:- start:717 stop:977 length:261 start_codon:yes stop_codon:yes gene_type:complete